MVLASELAENLIQLIKEHGDHPVMVFIADDGSYDIELPKFDTDGAGDNCYII